ncbi:nucleotide exchange factor GrpE [Rhodoplanes elegans]|nr:nucleotide exchange factor GrpE [Rhodoplanes elegans]
MSSPHSIEDEAVATEATDVATLLSENASLKDRLLRALADAENARRQADRKAEDTRKFAVAELARELLPVIDNLQRVLEARKTAQSSENDALLEGVETTLRLFLQTLERFGVKKIVASGQRFDPSLHEALMEADDASHPPGMVTQVLEDGYMIHDRLLRPARVVVSKKQPPMDQGSIL